MCHACTVFFVLGGEHYQQDWSNLFAVDPAHGWSASASRRLSNSQAQEHQQNLPNLSRLGSVAERSAAIGLSFWREKTRSRKRSKVGEVSPTAQTLF